ncbi:hypothetical protein [Rhodospirillum centenum]|uniref:Uncharacterized protein n=1 Tax=Rhodospirillum centenum (strain ATCC 51521 / SW) TaxID=414684 RepID=B6IXW4_RHOCS|nr:hypothetical protein [Rhodospirillum centenum]ACJ01138.1 hypothetical protein RC1_3795 [Rhodospirillum centenum SW]
MSGQSQEWRQLAASATALTDSKFLKIVELFEKVRHRSDIADAMQVIRPRMTELRPPRRLLPMRLFFLPVEDLLDDIGTYHRRLSRISRATLDPCWRIVAERLGAARLDRLEVILAGVDGHDAVALVREGEALWRDGARALGDALDEAHQNQKTRIRLFGRDDDVLRQVAVLVAVTGIGAPLQSVKARLPDRPVQALAEFHVEVLRRTIKELAAQDIRSVAPFLLALSARMLRPGDLLTVLADTRLDAPQQEKDAVAREVGVFALENLLRQSGSVPRMLKEGVAAREIATIAERLLDGFESMTATLQHPDQRKMVRRVDQARAVISEAILERVIGPADHELLGHVLAAAERDLIRPDLLPRPATPEEIARAEEFARAYRRCARIAPQVGLKPQMQEKTARLCHTVRRATEQLGILAQAPETTAADAATADEQIVSLLRLVEIVAGPDEAEHILLDWQERLGVGAAGDTPLYRETDL